MTVNQQAYQEAMNKGHSAAWDQSWEKAVQYYQQALQINPNNPMAFTNLGLAYLEIKEFDKALQCYTKAARLSPNDPSPPEKMARIYERLGHLKEAVNASLHAGQLFLKNRDAEKAIENYIHAINLQPEHLQARTRLALIFDRMGKKDEAVKEYLSAASIMQRKGELQKAAQAVSYCLKISPDNNLAQKAYELLQKKQLLPEPSRPHGITAPVRMAEVTKKDTSSGKEEEQDPMSEARQKALVQLASLLFEQPEKNSSFFKPNNKGQIEHAEITLHLGQAIDSQSRGQEKQAAKELEGAKNAGLNHPAVYFMLGFLFFKSDGKKALQYLQTTTRYPDYALTSHVLIGQIHYKTHNLKDAAYNYLHALRLADATTVTKEEARELRALYEPIIEEQIQQGSDDSYKELCDAISSQLMRNDWQNYVKVIRQQLPAQPPGSPPLPIAEILLDTNSSQVIETLTNIQKLADEDKVGSALEEAYYALDIAPTYLPLHIQIGDLLVKNGLTQDAVTKYNLVAKLYQLKGEINQAVGMLNYIIKLSPTDIDTRKELIKLLVAQNQFDDAIQQSLGLAQFYEYMVDFEKARHTYTEALRLCQKSQDTRKWSLKILYHITDIDLQRLDYRQALRVFEQIRSLEPDDTKARLKLVDLNYRLGQDKTAIGEAENYASTLESNNQINDAVQFLKLLIEDWPDKLPLRRLLAELCARTDRIAEAVEQFDYVADKLMENGDTENTIATLQRIVALNPPNMADYQAALAKLKNT